MMSNKCCRLCLASNSDTFLNLFADTGSEPNMTDIISEHFKCDVDESDPLPNFVCQTCWTTTDAFHELYQKSKAVQEKFLNPLIKVEVDPIDMWPNKETAFVEEHFEVGPVKIEPNFEEFDSDEPEMNYDENTNEDSANENSNYESGNEDEDDPEFKHSDDKPTTVRAQKRMKSKQKELEFTKIFNDNFHLFDMKCDLCPKTFKLLDEARSHYLTEHDNPKGYIKCCGAKLQYRCQVVSHLNRHLDPNRFKCEVCNRTYCNLRELQKHIKKHSEKVIRKKKSLPCDICKKLFASKNSLDRHMKNHEDKKEAEEGLHDKFIADNFDMTCDRCDAMFTAFHDARRHYKEYHDEVKGYIKCCNVKLKELWIVRDHIRSHLNPESFKCDVCSKSFSTRMVLVQHKRRHRMTMHKSFICDYCGKSCRDKDAITRHIFTNHVKSEPKFECDICHKKFQLQSLLKNHVYSVHREKKHSVTCEICGKSFYVKFHLDKHMLSHTDKSERLAQRKQCEHCGEWLMTKSGIYYHEQIHTSGVQKCEQCQIELPNKLALLAHIRQYHRQHKYKCSYCEKTFSTGSTLRTHEESHTRHNVYQCKFCPRVFTVPSSRRTHTRRNHQEELKQSKEIKNNAM